MSLQDRALTAADVARRAAIHGIRGDQEAYQTVKPQPQTHTPKPRTQNPPSAGFSVM